jgi:hypothetical protein
MDKVSTGIIAHSYPPNSVAVMAEEKAKPRFRFGIRTLLVLMALVAFSLAFVPKVYDKYYSVSLSDVVDNFNTRHIGDRIGALEPSITVEEVLKSLELEIPKLP